MKKILEKFGIFDRLHHIKVDKKSNSIKIWRVGRRICCQNNIHKYNQACILCILAFEKYEAALKVLAKVQINSSVVKNCTLELNKIGASTSVEIKWIKAHFGFTGNEMADQEAKSGTKKSVEEKIPPPYRMALSKIEEASSGIKGGPKVLNADKPNTGSQSLTTHYQKSWWEHLDSNLDRLSSWWLVITFSGTIRIL